VEPPPAQQPGNHPAGELVGPFGGRKRFAVEVLGNVLKTHGVAAQLLDTSQQSWICR
jgi:hypothetical protein